MFLAGQQTLHPPLNEAGVREASLALVEVSAAALAGAMQEMLDHPARREQLRQAGLACAAHFSWKQVAADTMAVLCEAAGVRLHGLHLAAPDPTWTATASAFLA